jgi:hypothetical protein
MRRLREAKKVLRELDEELAAASKATGKSLVWTASDRELLTLIADSMVHTDIPAPETMTTVKARRASLARWERERHATG